ncbi:MAG: isoleucine--tRNA ligase, partial [Bdellovibrionales bacterium]|nr:isoleucine--tRNA ligase [Bdellovibrionales bacterium]
CHGLPIELNVTKKLGKKREETSDSEVRKLCRQEALGWVEKQKEQFVRLGILADWENPYLTLQPEYEAEEVRVLAQVLDNGVLYRGEKPVYWCPALQTALAAAEVEYHDHKSPSVYVKFPVTKGLEKLGSPKKPVSFVIWTTTPWTLPANYGICVHENFAYNLYDTGTEYLIVAEDLKEAVEQDTGLSLNPTQSFKGGEFENMKADHPFMGRDSLIMIGDHVTLEAGTGCVHTAPGHGLEDYQVGLKYGLPVHSPVDVAGRFTDDVPMYKGIKIWEGNKLIVEDLQKSGHLLAHKEITHSYPHNPRSKTPLIFRSTPQWFVRMDDEKYPVRQMALNAAERDIKYFPGWGIQRLTSMIANSPDWCLSRQRIWGVPIPVFYCNSCGEALADSEVMRRIADTMEKSGEGIDAYHNRETSEFLQGKTCAKCGGSEFTKGQDILDVWFDSGVCHSAVQRKRDKLAFPADIYLEGSDQHRGWFQTSLMSAIASVGKPPYKALVTHGFVTDASGYKMSKSQGNVIDPAQVINKSGAEILRLWVAYEDYGQDVNIGDEIFQRVTETYRRFRNTMRFMLGNLDDFDPKKDRIAFKDMPELDQWALVRLNELIGKVRSAYDNYDFYKVYHALNNFFTVELSATYLDVLKDRLYTWKTGGRHRRAAQTVIYELTEKTLIIMAPIVSFLAEEGYEFLPGREHDSIFLCEFPQVNPEWTMEG